MMFGLIPAPYRLLAAGVAAAVLASAALLFVKHREHLADAAGYARGHSEFTTLQADMTAKALQGERDARATQDRWAAQQKENADESQRLATRDRAAHAAQDLRTGAAAERLRGDIATFTASRGQAAGDTAAGRQCAADLGTLGGILQSCRAEYRQLGRDADDELDDARSRGGQCAADYDALKPVIAGPQ